MGIARKGESLVARLLDARESRRCHLLRTRTVWPVSMARSRSFPQKKGGCERALDAVFRRRPSYGGSVMISSQALAS